MLYRPFLQYYSRRASANETANERCFALATAGINVCRNIIHLGLEIRRQAVLLGPFWFITNTQFFAILALVSYVLYNHDKPEAPKLFAEARLGKECISDLAQRSLAADRVTVALNVGVFRPEGGVVFLRKKKKYILTIVHSYRHSHFSTNSQTGHGEPVINCRQITQILTRTPGLLKPTRSAPLHRAICKYRPQLRRTPQEASLLSMSMGQRRSSTPRCTAKNNNWHRRT